MSRLRTILVIAVAGLLIAGCGGIKRKKAVKELRNPDIKKRHLAIDYLSANGGGDVLMDIIVV